MKWKKWPDFNTILGLKGTLVNWTDHVNLESLKRECKGKKKGGVG